MLAIATLIGLSMLGAPPMHVRADSSLDMPRDSAAMTLVVVQNERAVPVTVVLEHGSVDVTLGVIPAKSDGALRVPDRFSNSDVEIFVEARGALDQSTDLLNIEHGETLGVVVPRN